MSDFIKEISSFLSTAGYRISAMPDDPFLLGGQNATTVIFVVMSGEQLEQAVNVIAKVLTNPFRFKAFGPKTLDIYAVLVAPPTVSLTDIERCERNTRLCRKIVVRSVDELKERLEFLRPLRSMDVEVPDIESLFWDEIGKSLPESQTEVLRELHQEELTVHDAIKKALESE